MAGPADAIGEVTDQIHRMAEDMAKSDQSAQHLHISFSRMVGALGQFKVAELLVDAIKRTEVMQRLNSAISADNLNKTGLLRREISLDNERLNLLRLAGTATGKGLTLAQEELKIAEEQIKQLAQQKILAAEIESIGKARMTAIGIAVISASELFYKERQLNQSLIEANSGYKHRAKLLHDTLLTEAQIGIAFEQVTEAARALVYWNMDAEASFEANLRLVSQMEQGLGVSVNESARLASIVERQLKTSFEGIAHVIAQIVNDTALAGDEAARLATSISTAVGRLRPGMSAVGLPEVLKLVGRYEGALKEIGGAPGAFQQLIESLTRPEGILGAGALGVSPEFISTSKGVEDVMDRFARFGEALVGQTQGWERQMRLNVLAEMFQVSADQANQMMLAIKRARDEQIGAISVQDRWREQLHATNQGVSRLANSLGALLNGAMYPFIFAVGAVANKLADGLEWLMTNIPKLAYIISGSLTIAVIGLTGSLARLVRQMFATIVSTEALRASLMRAGIMGAVGTGIGGFSFLGTLRFLVTPLLTGLRLLLATPLGLIASLLGAGVVIWGKIHALNKESAEALKRPIDLRRARLLEEKREDRIFTEARNMGSPEEILKQHRFLLQDIANQALDEQDFKAKIQQEAERVLSLIDQGVTTAVAFKPFKDRTPEEAEREDELLGLTGKISEANQKALEEFKKQREHQKEMDETREVEVSKQRLQNMYHELGRKRTDMPYF